MGSDMEDAPFQFDAAVRYAEAVMDEYVPDARRYHDPGHARAVAREAGRIAERAGYGPVDRALLQTAAWYHDTGYAAGGEDHEERGAAMARNVLPRFGYAPDQCERVADAIRATTLPQQPVSDFDAVLCDADLHHFGSDTFLVTEMELKREWELMGEASYTLQGWFERTRGLMDDHDYHTAAGQELYGEKKDAHRAEIEEILTETP